MLKQLTETNVKNQMVSVAFSGKTKRKPGLYTSNNYTIWISEKIKSTISQVKKWAKTYNIIKSPYVLLWCISLIVFTTYDTSCEHLHFFVFL